MAKTHVRSRVSCQSRFDGVLCDDQQVALEAVDQSVQTTLVQANCLRIGSLATLTASAMARRRTASMTRMRRDSVSDACGRKTL